MKHSERIFHHVQSFQPRFSKNFKTFYNKADKNLQRQKFADNLNMYMSKEELSVFRKNELKMQYMDNRPSRWPCGLRPIDFRYERFESHSGHG